MGSDLTINNAAVIVLPELMGQTTTLQPLFVGTEDECLAEIKKLGVKITELESIGDK